MSKLIVNKSDSPFDSIRRFDAHGNEFWTARDLMQLVGYTNWRRFETPIQQAVENLELNGDVVSDHFDIKVKKSFGRDATDFSN
jgi:DNA-damage-inducible protein D